MASDWKDFTLYTDLYVKRFMMLVDKVAESKDSFCPEDFNCFDLLHYDGHENIMEFFRSLDHGSPLKVLEMGAGIGGTSRLIKNNFNVEMVSTEYLEGYCEVNKRINSMCGLDIKVVAGDACNLPLSELDCLGSCDIVFSIGVFLHIYDKPKLFSECNSALKSGGKLYIEDLTVENEVPFTLEEETAAQELGMQKLTKSQYVKYLEDAGFRVDFWEFRTTNWARYIYNRSEQIFANEANLREEGGEEWWAKWSDWCLNKIPKLYHQVDMPFEEVKAKWPVLTRKMGEDQMRKWACEEPQKAGGAYIIATKL